MMAYKGMNIFSGYDANLPTQLWLAQRYLLSISFLMAPVFLKRSFNPKWVMVVYALLTTVVLLTIFVFEIFPVSYVEGVGLTGFKKASEVVISGLFVAGAIILFKYKNYFDKKVFYSLLAAFFLNIGAEIMFTLYSSVFDLINISGHIITVGANYFIYKAIVETGLNTPYRLLFLELEKSNKAKDEFLNIASHELKTPITSIKAYSQVLAKHPNINLGGNSNSTIANKIDYQVDRIVFLINNLLDVGRIETGKMTFHFEKFNFDKMVVDTVEDLRKISDGHELILKGKTNRFVYGDRIRVGQVITNLITNAIKYSREDSKVVVKLSKEDNGVGVSVQDFGIGIPKEKLKSFSVSIIVIRAAAIWQKD